MTTWHRTDAHGTRVTFTYTVDDRGNVTLTREEVEGLMRVGGWKLGPIPERKTLAERLRLTAEELGIGEPWEYTPCCDCCGRRCREYNDAWNGDHRCQRCARKENR